MLARWEQGWIEWWIRYIATADSSGGLQRNCEKVSAESGFRRPPLWLMVNHCETFCQCLVLDKETHFLHIHSFLLCVPRGFLHLQVKAKIWRQFPSSLWIAGFHGIFSSFNKLTDVWLILSIPASRYYSRTRQNYPEQFSRWLYLSTIGGSDQLCSFLFL